MVNFQSHLCRSARFLSFSILLSGGNLAYSSGQECDCQVNIDLLKSIAYEAGWSADLTLTQPATAAFKSSVV